MADLTCDVTVTVLPIQGVEATRSMMIKACDEQLAKSRERLEVLDKHRQEHEAALANLNLQERLERERIRRVLGVQARWKLVVADDPPITTNGNL